MIDKRGRMVQNDLQRSFAHALIFGPKGDSQMPARSKAQQEAFAIAEHSPGKLSARNKGLLKMPKSKLSEFASTSRKGLPAKVSTKRK